MSFIKSMLPALGLFAVLGSAGAAGAQSITDCSFYGSPFYGCEAPFGGAEPSRTTSVYAGIQIAFGAAEPAAPRVVVGARRLRVGSGGDTNGQELALRFGLDGGLSLDSVVVSLVRGRTTVQGNAGLGYSFAQNRLMATAGAQVGHLRAGIDHVFTLSSPTYFIELNSLQKPAVSRGELGCADGLFLVSVGSDTGFAASPDRIVDGQTCVPPLG